ncbi:MAG TPA: HAMP domain-containing sensor histidine kinase [Ilumatobacteraceae bacterium]|nr:HAMP domain-containing sensor histidine kinase [Ilumatobacteraceae bacterium]
MTLRTRVVLIVAALVVAGIAIASYVAYSSTERQLVESTDDFLETRAAELLDGRRQPPQNDGNSKGDQPSDGGRLDADPDALSQTLNRDGGVTASSGDELPVESIDVEIATGANGNNGMIRNIELDDEPYRMITEPDRGGGAIQVARDTSATDDVLAGLRLQLVAFGAILAVVAAGSGWLLMRRTTQPLEDLTAATERVATDRDLTPLRLDRSDEVGRLAASFDRMLGALALSRDQQHRLVQDAAHELRTPLTSLRTNIELLDRARNLPDDELDAVLAALTAEVHELGQLFDELIQLSSDTGQQRSLDVEVDLADVVRDAADRFTRRTGREVTIDVEPTPILGNPALLERAVGNLLGNAHKFSPPDQPIEVSLHDRRVSVRDHGPGIPAAERARVFDRFHRSTEARSQPGSGLGLAIVAQIAELHGGVASADENPGGGANVGFTVA